MRKRERRPMAPQSITGLLTWTADTVTFGQHDLLAQHMGLYRREKDRAESLLVQHLLPGLGQQPRTARYPQLWILIEPPAVQERKAQVDEEGLRFATELVEQQQTVLLEDGLRVAQGLAYVASGVDGICGEDHVVGAPGNVQLGGRDFHVEETRG